MLWDPDLRFIAMTATERCLLSLQPLLLRLVNSCPKRLLGKRASETGRRVTPELTKRENGCRETQGGSTETWRGICVCGEMRNGSGRWSVASGGVMGRAEWKEARRSSMRMNCWKGSWRATLRGAAQVENLPQVEQALPAYLQVLKVRQTRVYVVIEKTGVLIPRVTVLERPDAPLLSHYPAIEGLLKLSKVLVELFADLLVPK